MSSWSHLPSLSQEIDKVEERSPLPQPDLPVKRSRKRNAVDRLTSSRAPFAFKQGLTSDAVAISCFVVGIFASMSNLRSFVLFVIPRSDESHDEDDDGDDLAICVARIQGQSY